jgi:hypothetical protein
LAEWNDVYEEEEKEQKIKNIDQYILFPSVSKKVELKSLEDPDGVCKVRKGKKVLIALPQHIERLWLYWLYIHLDEQRVMNWLVDCWGKRLSWETAKDIIKAFKQQHPPQDLLIDEYAYASICKSAKESMVISVGKYEFKLSASQEKELIDLMTLHKETSFKYIMEWFDIYRRKCKRDFNQEYGDDANYYLAAAFLQQHGINPHDVNKTLNKKQGVPWPTYLSRCVLCMVIFTVIYVGFLWIWVRGIVFTGIVNIDQASNQALMVCGGIIGGLMGIFRIPDEANKRGEYNYVEWAGLCVVIGGGFSIMTIPLYIILHCAILWGS